MAQPEKYYIDPEHGDDVTGDGSEAKPLRTAKRLYELLTPARVFPTGLEVNILADLPETDPITTSKLPRGTSFRGRRR